MKKKYTIKKRYSKKHHKKSKIYTKKHNKKGKTYTKRYTKKSKGGSTKKARWKNHKEFYNKLKKTSCSDITNDQTLTNKLKTNFINKFKTETSKEISNFTIFPYCNEDIKGVKVFGKNIEFSSVDSVNRPFTNNTALESLTYEFQIKNIPTSIKGLTFDKQGSVKSEKNDPAQFLNTFIYLIKNSGANDPTNYFIVSHSGFMTKLYDHISTLYYNLENNLNSADNHYDNLDILHLLINKAEIKNDNIVVSHMYVRRYEDSYIVQNKKAQLKKNIKSISEYKFTEHISVLIMRHCLGCHNVTPGLINKVSQAAIHTVNKNQYGYLDWSMCFEDTLDQLVKVKNGLIKVMQEYSNKKYSTNNPEKFYGINGYQFGSSVIFRAILTSLLMYNVLHDNVDETKLGGTAELSQSKPHEKVKVSQSKPPEEVEVSGDPPKEPSSKEGNPISNEIENKKPSKTINLICDCNKKR